MFNPRMILLMITILSMLLVPACGKNDNLQSGDSKVVAKINNYKLTIADFKSEAQDKLPANLSDIEFEKAKEDLLDEIITKKVLIQEAQKENFDKDRSFVKEIERYWEQALLKLLFRKKEQELMNTQALNKWIDGLKSRSDIKKYDENLKAVKKSEGLAHGK